ncbi:eosinophil peroxidase-like [Heterodontus francisci]|uniref:eosinophil peroxidase-like n=1 Tax=Heterodontus francisci TaxID=7792 RepID=UPI00355BD3BD
MKKLQYFEAAHEAGDGSEEGSLTRNVNSASLSTDAARPAEWFQHFLFLFQISSIRSILLLFHVSLDPVYIIYLFRFQMETIWPFSGCYVSVVDDENPLGSPFIPRAVDEAIELVNKAYKETRDCQKERLSKRSLNPGDLLRFFKHPTAETRVAVRSAEYMETALGLIQHHVHQIHKRSLNASDLLTAHDLDSIAHVTGCLAIRQPPVCEDDCWSNRYRTFNSECNNRRKPRLGASNTALTRWLPARYEDGILLPLGWTPNRLVSGFRLPLVREVSNKILRTSNKIVISDSVTSHLFMQWGQWIDHDMSLSPVSGSIQTFNDGINCETTCVQRNPCFPIRIPPNDTRINDTDTCMPFFRSAPACGSGELGALFGDVNTRQQINSLTSFLDVNEVYGSTECLANKLRNLTNEQGLLAVNEEFSDNGQEYLPFNTISSNLCGRMEEGCFTGQNSTPCFIAGDVRVNEQLGVLTFHTVFLREHNRLARELKRMNPHWSGDTTYLEARKILGAFQQIINHRDYVPLVIGEEATAKFLPAYEDYDEFVDPSIANVFSTAAFRFGHLSIQPTMFRLDENYQEHPEFKSLDLHQTFFTPWRLIREGGVDPLMRGLLGRPAKLQTQDKMMPDELREKLFKLTAHLALDLGSLNMQRSRDHGIPGYNAWRKFCGLSQPKNVIQLAAVLNNLELAKKLLNLYGTPDNIEVWVGGISEPFVEGGKVGPLLACLIGQQFKNLRNGDRLWWENAGVFTSSQRQALAEISMSRIICDNTRIEFLPRDAFQFQTFPQGYVNCSQIPQVDLSAWKEDVQVTPCGSVPVVAHAHFSICKSSVRYTCESGFKVAGGDTIKCLSNGQWNTAPPSCIDPEWTGSQEAQIHTALPGPKGGDPGPRGPERECCQPVLVSQNDTKRSAFSVQLKVSNLERRKPIPCAKEIYNGQGDYKCQTGIFTCQIPGVYQFSYHCGVSSSVTLFLKKNGITVITSQQNDYNRKNILSGSAILQLDFGDQIWLEVQFWRNGISVYSYFLGHLLFTV